jgi:putative NADH-flavin reductase
MRLTIFGATGGTGRCLHEQALDEGHEVTVVVRNPAGLAEQLRGRAREVVADLASVDPGTLEAAVAGADAVLSVLGRRRRKADPGIVALGTRAIVHAMRATGVGRIVVVTGAGIGTVPTPGNPNPPKHDPGNGFLQRHLGARLSRLLMRDHLADLALMEEILRDSGLDWTVVRPPLLTDKPPTRAYRTAYGQNVRGGFSISRADVAHCMLRALDRPETIKQAIGLAN